MTLQGSWNRAKRTGYKVVRLLFKDGKPTGAYEDFLVGFVADDAGVWGRPIGVAVARDGALIVSDEGGDVIWRVAYKRAVSRGGRGLERVAAMAGTRLLLPKGGRLRAWRGEFSID